MSTATGNGIRTEDLLPVMSRVSWGAILAGAFVSLAIYALSSALGIALGMSLVQSGRIESIGVGAGVWAIVSLLIALFAGGCVTTRCTAGESRREAVMYGAILWGVMFFMILWTTGSLLRTGSNMMVGSANPAGASHLNERVNWDRLAKEANLTEQQVIQVKNALPGASHSREVTAEAAWWSVGGMFISMLASIAGAVVGSGPSMMLEGLSVRRTTATSSSGMTAPTR